MLLGEDLSTGPWRQLDLWNITVLSAFVPQHFHLVVVREEGEPRCRSKDEAINALHRRQKSACDLLGATQQIAPSSHSVSSHHC